MAVVRRIWKRLMFSLDPVLIRLNRKWILVPICYPLSRWSTKIRVKNLSFFVWKASNLRSLVLKRIMIEKNDAQVIKKNFKSFAELLIIWWWRFSSKATSFFGFHVQFFFSQQTNKRKTILNKIFNKIDANCIFQKMSIKQFCPEKQERSWCINEPS